MADTNCEQCGKIIPLWYAMRLQQEAETNKDKELCAVCRVLGGQITAKSIQRILADKA